MILTEQQIINTIKKVISEARRNPETNVDESFTDFYNRMIQKAPIKNIFISFRDTIHVTDVNPVNVYSTPTGFYTYPLVAFNIPDNPTEIEFRGKFPFGNDRKYINFFILKNHDGILTSKTDKSTLNMYVERIKKLYPNSSKVKELCDSFIDGSYSSDYNKTPVHDTHLFWLFLYDITKDMQKKNKQNRINLICRKIGVNGIIDYEGHEYIHSAEPSQAVFFRVKNLGEVFIYEKPKLSNNAFKGMIQNKKYLFVKELTDDINLVYLSGRYSLTNKNGELITKQWFDYIGDFENGLSKVSKKGRWNFINQNGELISKQWFERIDIFSDGFIRVRVKGMWNIINQNGEFLSKLWFDYFGYFKNGLAQVKLGAKWNFINQNGELIFNKWFDRIFDFEDGFFIVELNKKLNVINQNGELVFPNQWFEWSDYYNIKIPNSIK